jgi:hypothetical protein
MAQEERNSNIFLKPPIILLENYIHNYFYTNYN